MIEGQLSSSMLLTRPVGAVRIADMTHLRGRSVVVTGAGHDGASYQCRAKAGDVGVFLDRCATR